MGMRYSEITAEPQEFIARQRLFFDVAAARDVRWAEHKGADGSARILERTQPVQP